MKQWSNPQCFFFVLYSVPQNSVERVAPIRIAVMTLVDCPVFLEGKSEKKIWCNDPASSCTLDIIDCLLSCANSFGLKRMSCSLFAALVRGSLRDREMEDICGLKKYGIEIVGKSWLRNILWSRLGVSLVPCHDCWA